MLKITNLRKFVQEKSVLKDVSFTVIYEAVALTNYKCQYTAPFLWVFRYINWYLLISTLKTKVIRILFFVFIWLLLS